MTGRKNQASRIILVKLGGLLHGATECDMIALFCYKIRSVSILRVEKVI